MQLRDFWLQYISDTAAATVPPSCDVVIKCVTCTNVLIKFCYCQRNIERELNQFSFYILPLLRHTFQTTKKLAVLMLFNHRVFFELLFLMYV
jgi:hypothetical protein